MTSRVQKVVIKIETPGLSETHRKEPDALVDPPLPQLLPVCSLRILYKACLSSPQIVAVR